MKLHMRLTIASFAFFTVGVVSRLLHAQNTPKPEDRTQVEFYIATGRRQPPPTYRVKWFRRIGTTSPELAGKFRGLAAKDLDKGEYEYVLEPEVPPPGPPGVFRLTGKVQLYGPFPHWITLEMPTGVVADMEPSWIDGRVLPVPATGQDQLWIRFQDVVDHSNFFQTKLDSDGVFRIPSPGSKENDVVTVCRGTDVVFVDVVHFMDGRPDHPLQFRLKPDAIR